MCVGTVPSRPERYAAALVGMSASTNTRTARIQLFHADAAETCQNAQAEKNSQTAITASTQRAIGSYSAQIAPSAISAPQIHELVNEAAVCGQTQLEMNSQIPSARLIQIGQTGLAPDRREVVVVTGGGRRAATAVSGRRSRRFDLACVLLALMRSRARGMPLQHGRDSIRRREQPEDAAGVEERDGRAEPLRIARSSVTTPWNALPV